METKKRYTDEELEEFKQLIEGKLVVARAEFEAMMRSVRGEDSNDVDDTMPTYKILEEGSSAQTKEDLMRMAARHQKYIQGLEGAMLRIKHKTYGIDRMTGELIPKERLRAVPHATLSVASKMSNKNH